MQIKPRAVSNVTSQVGLRLRKYYWLNTVSAIIRKRSQGSGIWWLVFLTPITDKLD